MKLNDLNMSDEELDELEDLLKNRKKEKIYNYNLKKIEENKKYVGKCYIEDNKYIRIISSKSSNEFRLEAMCFKFPIDYSRHNMSSKIFMPDSAFGTIDFDGFYIEDYPLLCTGQKRKIKEISEDEYFAKMDEYLKDLKEKLKNGFFDEKK